MFKKYAIQAILMLLAASPFLIGFGLYNDYQTAKKVKEEKAQSELASKLKYINYNTNFQTPVFSPPPTNPYDQCATNNTLPICSMNIVPIDPTPAEQAMRNNRFPR
jgi:hypothetical protein